MLSIMKCFCEGRNRFMFFIAFAVIFSTFSSIPASALPAFDIDTQISPTSFYTLPLLSSKDFEYNYTSTFLGTPLETYASVDIIHGSTTNRWWATAYEYRTPVTYVFTAQDDKTTDIVLDTEYLISQKKLRSDCRDLRLVSSDTNVVSTIIEDCNSNETLIRFKQSAINLNDMFLYYDNPSGSNSLDEHGAYLFYDEFDDESFFNSSWDVNGNYSIDSSTFSSQSVVNGSNLTELNLTTTNIISNSEIKFDFSISSGGLMSIVLGDPSSFHNSFFQINISESEDVVEVCLVQSGFYSCDSFASSISSGSTNEFYIDITGSSLNLYFNDVRLNPVSIYYNFGQTKLVFDFHGDSSLHSFSYLEKKTENFDFDSEENLIYHQEGTAFGGSYGFSMPGLGLADGTYSVVTFASRAGMEDIGQTLNFDANYNKITFKTIEVGYVTPASGRYVIDVEGVLKISNNNDEDIFLNMPINSPLLVNEKGGSRITSSSVSLNLAAFSTVTIPYLATGILTENPISELYLGGRPIGVFGSILKPSLNLNIHTFLESDFTQLYKESPVEKVIKEVGEEIDTSKQFKYTIEGGYIFDEYSLLKIRKYASSHFLKRGDLIDVVIKITNDDPFSRMATISDFIPDEFVLYENSRPNKDKKNLAWTFKMNKEVSRIVEYQMMYVGESTGGFDIPNANATSERLRVLSNNISIMRLQEDSRALYITKYIERWNDSEVFEFLDAARVTISIVNPSAYTIENILVDENFDGSELFLASSIPSRNSARWEIDSLKPGEVWTVTYTTNQHKNLAKLTKLSSFTDEIFYEGEIKEEDESKNGLYVVTHNKFPMGLILALFFFLDLVIIGFYVYHNPLFEVGEEAVSVNLYVRKFFEIFNKKTVDKKIDEITTKIAKKIANLIKALKNFDKNIRDWISSFSKSSKKYYHERNISIPEDVTKSLWSRFKHELHELKDFKPKDVFLLIAHYNSKFWSELFNSFTLGMLRSSRKLLSRNDRNKMGLILNFSAKVLNPELKLYMGELVKRKLNRQEKSYRIEISKLDALQHKNELLKQNSESKKAKLNGFKGKLTSAISKFFSLFRAKKDDEL